MLYFLKLRSSRSFWYGKIQNHLKRYSCRFFGTMSGSVSTTSCSIHAHSCNVATILNAINDMLVYLFLGCTSLFLSVCLGTALTVNCFLLAFVAFSSLRMYAISGKQISVSLAVACLMTTNIVISVVRDFHPHPAYSYQTNSVHRSTRTLFCIKSDHLPALSRAA